MSAVISRTSIAPDLAAVKARQQVAWSTGNYAVVGTTLQIVGETLCEALDLHSGARVLDVAAGNGNATLAAARRWCDVISTDYVGSLLESGRARALAEGLKVQFQEADAEALPFANEAFDAVLSIFGVMFTPHQEQAAIELSRVCKPGGRIGLANWTPESFIGRSIQDHRQVRAARRRRQIASPMGNADATAGVIWHSRQDDQLRESRVRLPVSLTAALARCLQKLLRADEQDLRRACCEAAG